MVTLQEIKDQIAKYLYLIDTDVIDVTIATVLANRLPGDSISLYIVGPSSSAKTELIYAIAQSSHVEMVSIITPHALVSGYKEGPKDKTDYSVLARLQTEDKNILAFKDFTTIISMRREDRAQFMSQLRELADGEISGLYGNRPKVILKSKFGMIAACTNAIDEFTAGILILGERFLKYRISAEMTDEIARLAMATNLTKDVLRADAAQMIKEFLSQYELIFQDVPGWEPTFRDKVQRLCTLGAHLRTPIIRDERGMQVSEVDHEGPGRLVSSISKLSMALSLVRGYDIIDQRLYPILKKVIRDTMPPYRLRILEMIYEAPRCVELTDITKRLGIDRKTASRYCSELESLRICKREVFPRVRTELYITGTYIRMIEDSEIFILDKI